MKTDWEQIYNRFDPEEPVPLERPGWRVERPYNPADQLKPEPNRPFGDKRFLIIGTVGTGKSTELHQLAEARTERDFVIVVDLWSHFLDKVGDRSALDHVQPWEVIFLVGLHVYRAAEDRGHHWSPDTAARLATARQRFGDTDGGPMIDIAQLAKSVSVLVGGTLDGGAAAGVAALGAVMGSGRWTLPIGRRKRTLDQDERVQDMLQVVNTLLGELQSAYKRVALFIDGLDRVRELETVHNLFVESSLLGKLVCTTVLTGPILVRRAGLGATIRGFDTRVLANVPVLGADQPRTLSTEGGRFFRAAWSRRVHELRAEAAIADAELDTLAWTSGGRAREFVRLVRMVAERSYDAGVDVTTPALVETVIDARRRTFELGVNRRHVQLLEGVIADPRHQLPDDAETAVLLDRFWLLPYPNESEWYYPHPLLLLAKLRGSGGSGGA